VQLDFQSVRPVITGLIQHNVTARDKIEPAGALEKKAGGAGQRCPRRHRRNSSHGYQ
jgi:hypothetical protein